jgi:methyl-accepting chemotaxis protein
VIRGVERRRSGVTDGDPISTTLRRLLLIDVTVTIAHAGLWVILHLVTPTVAVVTSLLRMAVWLAYAHHSLGPVREWRRRDEPDPDGRRLLAAHASLEGFARRVGLAHLLGWIIGDALWLALAFLGIPEELPVGRAELLSAMMLASSLLLAPLLIEPVADHTLSELHTEIGSMLVVQHRQIDLAAPTIPRAMTRMVVAAVLATTVGISGAWLELRVGSVRATALAEQRRLVEVTAIRADAGLGAALEGVELVERDALPPQLAAELQRRGGPAVLSLHDARHERVYAAAPLADGRWAVAEAQPEEALGLSLALVVALIVLFAPIFSLAAWAYARSIAQPIERFAEAMEGFSSRGELRARTVPLRGNEVGRLSASFNRMLDILEELARAAKTVAEGDLSVELERAGELHDAFRGMLARLNEIVGRMRETSLEVASAAAEIQALTQQQQGAAEQQSSGVRQVSATVVSLADAAQRIATTAQGVLDNAEQTVTTTDAMTEKIAALRGHAASVTALLEVIREIADRSDLLALNGSLEATRAGEAGRGFALVATEMRRLAERVTRTVADVRAQVTDIEASGTNTVMATEQSRKLAQLTAAAARQIWTVTGQQSADTKEAALGVHALAEVVVASTAAVAQTHTAAEGLRVHAAELERLLATFRTIDSTPSC